MPPASDIVVALVLAAYINLIASAVPEVPYLPNHPGIPSNLLATIDPLGFNPTDELASLGVALKKPLDIEELKPLIALLIRILPVWPVPPNTMFEPLFVTIIRSSAPYPATAASVKIPASPLLNDIACAPRVMVFVPEVILIPPPDSHEVDVSVNDSVALLDSNAVLVPEVTLTAPLNSPEAPVMSPLNIALPLEAFIENVGEFKALYAAIPELFITTLAPVPGPVALALPFENTVIPAELIAVILLAESVIVAALFVSFVATAVLVVPRLVLVVAKLVLVVAKLVLVVVS
jgi:hypothetical protein